LLGWVCARNCLRTVESRPGACAALVAGNLYWACVLCWGCVLLQPLPRQPAVVPAPRWAPASGQEPQVTLSAWNLSVLLDKMCA
jgi:hypothetical protein